MPAGRAAVTDGRGNFLIEEIAMPPVGPGEVGVQIRASGICHTDYDSMRWGRRLIMGHEGAGTVVAAGPEVHNCSVGDRVVLNWAMPCLDCPQCQRGNEHLCERHSPVVGPAAMSESDRAFGLGTLSTHTVVPAAAVTVLPETMPFTSACLFGCAVMTGYGSVVNVARVQPGWSVVVLGAGGVGLNVVQTARIAAAAAIIAVDIRPERLELARRFGATHTLIGTNDLVETSETVRELLEGQGADVAFECTGIPELGVAPLRFVRHGGMAVQVSGVEQTVAVDLELFEWDKTYVNPLYGQCRPARDFPDMFRLYAEGKLMVDELVSRTYQLEDLSRAFDDMLTGVHAKGVVVFDD